MVELCCFFFFLVLYSCAAQPEIYLLLGLPVVFLPFLSLIISCTFNQNLILLVALFVLATLSTCHTVFSRTGKSRGTWEPSSQKIFREQGFPQKIIERCCRFTEILLGFTARHEILAKNCKRMHFSAISYFLLKK